MTATLVTIAHRVDAGLVRPGSAHRLAVVRAGLAAVIALRLASGPYRELAGQPWPLFRPPPFLSWLSEMPSVEVLVTVQVCGTLAALAAVAGCSVSRTLPLAWCSLLLLAGLRGSLGKVLHNDLLVLLATVPLLFAPPDARLGDHRTSARWGWPVRGALAVVAVVYWACGMQKLRNTGVTWVTGETMRWILQAGATDGAAPTTLVAEFLVNRAWLTHIVAASILALELFAPLLLAWPASRRVFALGVTLLHVGTWLTLGLDYWGWVLAVAVLAWPSAGADAHHDSCATGRRVAAGDLASGGSRSGEFYGGDSPHAVRGPPCRDCQL